MPCGFEAIGVGYICDLLSPWSLAVLANLDGDMLLDELYEGVSVVLFLSKRAATLLMDGIPLRARTLPR